MSLSLTLRCKCNNTLRFELLIVLWENSVVRCPMSVVSWDFQIRLANELKAPQKKN